MPDPSDIPSGFYISTPANNAIANTSAGSLSQAVTINFVVIDTYAA